MEEQTPLGASVGSALMGDLVNLADYERLAAERLDPGVLAYYAGGAGDELTLRENVAAFDRLRLRPRVLVGVADTTAATTVLGTPLSMPVLVAPTAIQRAAHPDGEPGTARAAAQAGTLMVLSTIATASPSEVAAAAPGAPRWFQVYVLRDRGVTRALVDEAVDHGFSALVLTVDAPWVGRRERDYRTGFALPPGLDMPAITAVLGETACPTPRDFLGLVDASLTWRDLEVLVAESTVPVIVKGIHTAEDALLAVEHGAAAVIVSNHGGRQLDAVEASIDVLPEVVDAVGDQVEVMVDGGVRRGTHVCAALALGARAVLLGRPVLWGLAVDGEAGVRRVLDIMRAEVELALALLGCASPADVRPEHVRGVS